jgi:hypothetical protein
VLAWFRRHARHFAVTTLASLATLGVAGVLPHADDCHGDGCLYVSVRHDASAHRFEGGSTPGQGHPLHCLVCHWTRSFRPPADVAFIAAPVAESRPRTFVVSFTAARPVQAAQPPLRSPPLTFSS